MTAPAIHPSAQVPVARDLEAAFDLEFRDCQTRLQGGADEPFYRPASGEEPATIFFRADFVRSALHEVAHWCHAGPVRRNLPDYGYWYTPDDRDARQQAAFFAVEARPQALEQIFCEALGIAFRPSIDNLSLEIPENQCRAFAVRVDTARTRYLSEGLPGRAARFRRVLHSLSGL